jgi:large subunit ribosomal protein L19
MNVIDKIEKEYYRASTPTFRAGDTVRVLVRLPEGENRKQAFEGVCLRRNNAGVRSTFTVRKMSSGIGVERIFPLHSPFIEQIDVVKQGRVRQSRIYYLRERFGKAARIKERRAN